jgi:hypothetical protein
MTVNRISPEEVALLVAASRVPDARTAAIIESPIDNVGNVFLIGAVSFPPAVGTPSRSLQEEERWYAAFTSLWRDRHWIQHEKDRAYKVAGPGWQIIEMLKASKVKDADGSFVWNKLVQSLGDLGKAQAINTNDEVVRLGALVVQLSEKLIP